MWSNNDGIDPNWKPDYTPKANVIGTLNEEIIRLKQELDRYKDEVHRLRGRLSHYETPIQNCELIAAMRNNIKPMIEELWTLRKLADAFKKAQEEHYCNVPIEVHDAVAEYEKLMGCEK